MVAVGRIFKFVDARVLIVLVRDVGLVVSTGGFMEKLAAYIWGQSQQRKLLVSGKSCPQLLAHCCRELEMARRYPWY